MRRSVVDCPEWLDDVPVERRALHKEALAAAYQQVCSDAASTVIDVSGPRLWHHVMFRCVVPLDYYAGNFRQDDPGRVCLGLDVGVDGLPGYPFASVPSAMQRLVDDVGRSLVTIEISWRYTDDRQRALQLSLLIAHLVGVFVRIHPFLNGNGRVSRLLWAWGLLRFGVPIQCRLTPRPDMPYADIMRRAMQGDNRPLALQILRHLARHGPRQVPG